MFLAKLIKKFFLIWLISSNKYVLSIEYSVLDVFYKNSLNMIE